MKIRKTVVVLLLALVGLLAVGCDTGISDNGDTPTLTDIKIVADASQILTGPNLTTLEVGNQYIVLVFFSDQDLDIVKMVVDYYKDGVFVTTSETPVVGQATVSDVGIGYLDVVEEGLWRCEAYVEDAKGNRSNRKSITVTVVGAMASFELLLDTFESYVANNGNTVFYRKNLTQDAAHDLDEKFYNMAFSAGYYLDTVIPTGTAPIESLPSQTRPNNNTYVIIYAFTPDKNTINCLYSVRVGNDSIGYGYTLVR